MYQICLVIKENLREEQASMLIHGCETLDEASNVILKLFDTLQTIFSLLPGESITIYSEGSENSSMAPPNLVGEDGESQPVF